MLNMLFSIVTNTEEKLAMGASCYQKPCKPIKEQKVYIVIISKAVLCSGLVHIIWVHWLIGRW